MMSRYCPRFSRYKKKRCWPHAARQDLQRFLWRKWREQNKILLYSTVSWLCISMMAWRRTIFHSWFRYDCVHDGQCLCAWRVLTTECVLDWAWRTRILCMTEGQWRTMIFCLMNPDLSWLCAWLTMIEHAWAHDGPDAPGELQLVLSLALHLPPHRQHLLPV